MAMGMSYDDFWYGDLDIAKYTLKAHRLKKDQMNEQLWLQGLYVYEAMRRLYPLFNPFSKEKPEEYFKEPIPFSKPKKEDKKEREQIAEMEKMRAYLMNMVAQAKKEKEGGQTEHA